MNWLSSDYLDLAANTYAGFGRGILMDYLMDCGVEFAGEAHEDLPQSQYLPSDYYGRGNGIGIGIGRGIGSGRGRGSGSGRGSGIGSGRGSGRGSGIGSGRGRGSGRGSGIGSGIRTKEPKMEPGKAYLIFTVDWFAWVGRMVRQIGPWEYEFESVSKFDTNAGDVFGEIAAGDESLRKGCSYQHFKGVCILGQGAVGKIPWEGKTPQESGLGVAARRRS